MTLGDWHDGRPHARSRRGHVLLQGAVLDPHEAAFVRAFILPKKQERYLSKLASPKHRRSHLARLNHRFDVDLDPRWTVSEAQARALVPAVCECRVLSADPRADARVVAPDEAFTILALAFGGLVVSFVPGRLAVYQQEGLQRRTWLAR